MTKGNLVEGNPKLDKRLKEILPTPLQLARIENKQQVRPLGLGFHEYARHGSCASKFDSKRMFNGKSTPV